MFRHERVTSLHDLLEEGRTDRIDEVRGENSGGEHVDRIVRPAFLVVQRRALVIEILPERRRVDAAVFDLGQRRLVGVDVVHREEARNPHPPGGGRDEPGHPVVAVDQIRLHVRDDVVDHLALERHRLKKAVLRITAVNRIPVVEDAVLRQMNPAVVQVAHVDAQLVADQLADVDVEHLAVVRQRDVHVGSLAEQGADQRGRHIRQAAGLGVQHICHVAHPLGKIGDFRGDDQDGRRFVIGSSHHIGVLLTLPEN